MVKAVFRLLLSASAADNVAIVAPSLETEWRTALLLQLVGNASVPVGEETVRLQSLTAIDETAAAVSSPRSGSTDHHAAVSSVSPSALHAASMLILSNRSYEQDAERAEASARMEREVRAVFAALRDGKLPPSPLLSALLVNASVLICDASASYLTIPV